MSGFLYRLGMDLDESANDWLSGDKPQRQLHNAASSANQRVRGARLPQRRELRPARNTLPFVPYATYTEYQLTVQ